MPTCIYCKATTRGDESEDHPIPQALGTINYPLPRGAVCLDCNAYFAGNLDQNFCDHHHLAAFIALWRILGTGGRVRTAITPDFSIDPVEAQVSIRARPGEATSRDGTLAVESAGNRQFSDWKFSRGLHRIGLGVLALQSGAETALDRRYDNVRRYIRRPADRAEFWPYYQRIAGGFLPKIFVSFAIGDAATFFWFFTDLSTARGG